MSLPSGTRLGPYEVVAQIGVGGEVYRRDGRELFYMTIEGDVMSVTVDGSSSFRAGVPSRVLTSGYYTNGYRTYDVSRDGGRFLVIKEIEQPDRVRNINVVQTFFEELKRLVPAD